MVGTILFPWLAHGCYREPDAALYVTRKCPTRPGRSRTTSLCAQTIASQLNRIRTRIHAVNERFTSITLQLNFYNSLAGPCLAGTCLAGTLGRYSEYPTMNQVLIVSVS